MMRRFIQIAVTLPLVATGASIQAARASDGVFAPAVQPILQAHCSHSHHADDPSGGVDFSAMNDHASAMTQYSLWRKVIELMQTGSMPPEVETPLTRQFTRDEYSQTIRDLLRLNFDAAGEAGIPHENVVDGFASRAGGLVMEPSLMEKYFTATDLALEHLFTNPAAASARKSLLVAVPAESLTATDAVRQVLRPFLGRAFRRPVNDLEVER